MLSALIDTANLPWTLAALAIGYLLGSIPFGLIFTRMAGLGDIRDIGSGNIGATNALRTGNKKVAGATFLFDAAKGAVAVLLFSYLAPSLELVLPLAALAAAGAFLGHLFPVWLRFKGGKGISTFIGINLALYWPVGLLFCATWLAVAALFRYSSLAALVAALATPAYLALFGHYDLLPLSVALVAMIYFAHRDNITRLLSGNESRIGSK
ncbi:MAG: glycerol-3-phosphate 1-O-acyltransferase PlsY [Parvibaculum sp.]|nr:glycerol-3-phosphate 1-O-acyltransferase PlsY [Parvibaculum sp.]|tara:strand:+ start:2475 stop:3104 length:630 start_codon:yes stop_codon:yes gene_type:complete